MKVLPKKTIALAQETNGRRNEFLVEWRDDRLLLKPTVSQRLRLKPHLLVSVFYKLTIFLLVSYDTKLVNFPD